MAVVERWTTLAIEGPGGQSERRFQAVVNSSQESAPGGLVVISVTNAGGGITPPPAPDTYYLSLGLDNSTTSYVKTFVLDPVASTATVNFYMTSDGTATGQPRAGTLRMRIDAAKTTGTVTERYSVNSDNTSGETLGTGQTVTVRNQGWIRSTASYTQALSNVAAGGAKNVPFQYQDNIYIRTTLNAQLYTARSLTVRLRERGVITVRTGITNTATNGNFDRSFTGTSTSTGRVNKGFSPTPFEYSTDMLAPNATLTGLPDFTVSSSTPDTVDIDPRVTVKHHLQINNGNYSTPPLSAPSTATERVFPDLGYLATAVYAARGAVNDTVLTGGLDGITFNITFTDPLGGNIGNTGYTTATRGGEAGWQNTILAWANAVAGVHEKAVIITNSDINDIAYWVNSTISYSLIALNPAIQAMVAGGNLASQGRHAQIGDTITAGMVIIDTAERELVTTDSGTAQIVVRRISLTEGSQHLKADGTWANDIDGTGTPVKAYSFTANESATGSRLYVVNLPSNALSDGSDLFLVGRGLYQGSPYKANAQVTVVGAANPHTGNEFDPTGLFK